MKAMLLFGATFVALRVAVALECGENILRNGELSADQNDMPAFWGASGSRDVLFWEESGGPKGMPCLTFKGGAGADGEFVVQQTGLVLATNGLYRLSALVRTRNFKSPHCAIAVAAGGWGKENGRSTFPENSEWTRIVEEFHPNPSPRSASFAVIYACNFKGTLQVADVKLEALDEAARAGTHSLLGELGERPRVVPWKMDPRYIRSAHKVVRFKVFGALPSSACEVRLSCDGKAPSSAVLSAGRRELEVPVPAGFSEGMLSVSVVDSQSGVELCTRRFYGRVVAPVKTGGQRRLNNFVREVCAEDLGDASERTFEFAADRDGWAFVAVESCETRPDVLLDGKPVLSRDSARSEAFRTIRYGKHRVDVKGAKGGRIVVRLLKEILVHGACVWPFIPQRRGYSWDFMRDCVLSSATSLNCCSISSKPERLEEFRVSGQQRLDWLGVSQIKSEEEAMSKFESNRNLNANALSDGVTADELFFRNPEQLQWYLSALKAYSNPSNKIIHTWIVENPGTEGLDQDFFATCREASSGRGLLLLERYCGTKDTERIARDAIRRNCIGVLADYNKCYPGIESSSCAILAGFTQHPRMSIILHPEVDYKYHLDLQLNLLANDPAAARFGGTGFWGLDHADSEIDKWSFRLLRHYCVEGRTNMLSSAYGYTYIPQHITNGDFRVDFSGWTVKGDVERDVIKGLGKAEGRWSSRGTGDTFALLARYPGTTNVLSQTIRNLIPGRKYRLQMIVFDVDDMKCGKGKTRRYPVEATLSPSAQVVKADSWVYVNEKPKKGYAPVNMHQTVFVPQTSEVVLEISDAKSYPGCRHGVNFVSVLPYYDGN